MLFKSLVWIVFLSICQCSFHFQSCAITSFCIQLRLVVSILSSWFKTRQAFEWLLIKEISMTDSAPKRCCQCASVSLLTRPLSKTSHARSSTDESFSSSTSPTERKHRRTHWVIVHGFLLEKQNVKTSMYNLECRSTELNSWTGRGLAAPTHTHLHTQAHAQTQDRNAAQHRPCPH